MLPNNKRGCCIQSKHSAHFWLRMIFALTEIKYFLISHPSVFCFVIVLPFYCCKGVGSFLLYPHDLTRAFKWKRVSHYENITCQDNSTMIWNKALGCGNWLTFHQWKLITLVFWQSSSKHTSEWGGMIYVHWLNNERVLIIRSSIVAGPIASNLVIPL